MSQDRQSSSVSPPESQAVVVVSFPMPRGSVFDWHTHSDHQLAWAPTGVLMVRTESTAWVLPPTRALWIPQGVRHETFSTSSATMQAAYLRPHLCPITWADCTPVAISALLGELISYLAEPDLERAARTRGEGVVIDLLRPVEMATIDVPMPREGGRAMSPKRCGTRPPTAGRLASGGARSVRASAHSPDPFSPTRDSPSAAGGPYSG